MPTASARRRAAQLKYERSDPGIATKLRYLEKIRGGGCFPGSLIERLREHQRGRCALCTVVLTTSTRAGANRECADHCHRSLTPRGLLCSTCNFALGQYERLQAPAGLYIAAYERYLDLPPANVVDLALAPMEDEE